MYREQKFCGLLLNNSPPFASTAIVYNNCLVPAGRCMLLLLLLDHYAIQLSQLTTVYMPAKLVCSLHSNIHRTNGRERVVCWLLNLRMDRAANWLLVELSSYNCWNLLLPPAQNYCCSVGEFGFGVATRCCFGCIYSASLLLRQQTYAPYYIGCLVVSEIQRDWTGV